MPHSILNKLLIRSLLWARKYYISQILTALLSIVAVVLVVATYYALAESQPLDGSSKQTVVLLNCDLAVLLLLSFIVAYRVMKFRMSRVSGAAPRLHARLIRWFGMLLVTPAIIVTLFSASFFNLGIESWFSKHVRVAIKNSKNVAEAYLNEHNKGVAAETRTLAESLARKLPISDAEMINEYVNEQAAIRSLSEVIVFTPDGTVLAQTRLSFSLAFKLDQLSQMDFDQAKEHVMIFHNEAQDRVRAFVRVDPKMNVYLIVGRYVDPLVLTHINNTRKASSEYKRLEQSRGDIEIKFILIFIAFSLLLLLFVIWIGMAFANRLAAPISALIAASEKIRAGDLSARVDEKPDQDEFGLLSRTFNRMTTELEHQRTKLVEANIQIDRRRHFIETVLSGVSAGVLALDAHFNVNIANKFARSLLGLTKEEVVGRSLQELIPEMVDLLEQARNGPVQSQLQFTRDAKTHTLLVRIAVEREEDVVVGYIVTFDDITLLVSAQRKAAWSDVARRIAHEIKNPLTPIQLSAERLKKKYQPQIKDDPETFLRYVDTISRQVSYIGDMVKEFSEFARMPEAVLERQNLDDLCEEAIFLQRTAHPEIMFTLKSVGEKKYIYCDSSQISQILTNLLLNAIDAIDAVKENKPDHIGKITVELECDKDHIVLLVDDNGDGFPTQDREKLLEPYVTERSKGTGLGLAIVRRTMDAHNGLITLEDVPGGGARIRLVFPKGPIQTMQEDEFGQIQPTKKTA
jgi:two-component system, NtrC family, nitrogen regulation sensor histidine kinase NtrY